ncbi:MAG: hypothetical protein HQ481_08800 [Alphaproteobacteria bacterium]|nr:hypothetical protein [Alphaproteobacteria bacterium]
MTTHERELLAFATKVERAPMFKVAVLSDLSRIPHIEDPTFFGVLRKRLENAVKDLEVLEFELSNYQICHVLDPGDASRLVQSLGRISKLLADHGKLPIEVRTFELQHHPDEFRDHARLLMAELQADPARAYTEMSEEDENLDRYLAIDENLHAADISSLIREQPVYDFTDGERPEIVAFELSSAINELEEVYGVPIRSNAWLFSRITAILDERMMKHLTRDLDMSRRRISINLHLSSILGPAFREFSHRTSFGWQGNLIFEIPFLEVLESPDDFRAALDILRYNHGLAAVDDVPLMQLERIPDMPEQVRFIKVRWSDDLAKLDSDAEIPVLKQLERFGRERCVLTHCENVVSVETALRLGFRVLQGHGVDADVAELRRHQIDRTIAVIDMQHSLFDETEDEAPANPIANFFKSIFGGRRRGPEDGEM